MRCIVALGAVLAALVIAGAAQASGDQISLAVAAGASDAGVTVTVSGAVSSSDDYQIDVHYQPPGPCAGDPDGNSPISPDGATVQQSPGAFGAVVGDPTLQQLLPGTYALCAWLVDLDNSSTTVATYARTITVGSADSIALSETTAPIQGREFDIDAAGTDYDRGAIIEATIKPAPNSCAATPGADPGEQLNGWDNAAGPNSANAYVSDIGANMFLTPGSYLVCAWLLDQGTSTLLAHGQQTLTVPGLSPNLHITAPGTVGRGQATDVSVTATLPSGVTVEAVVDAFSKHSHPTCPSRPPSNADSAIDEELTGTQQPVRVSTVEPVTVSSTTLVCAWLLDGWSGADSPPVVAGPVAATISAAPPLTFRGHTAQHKSMSILTAPFASAITGVQFGVHLRCNGTPRLLTGRPWNGVDKETITAFTFGRVKPDHSGRFKIRLTSNPKHTFTLQGRVSGKTITGSFTETGRSWVFTSNHGQNLRCTSGVVKFSLHTP